jgi:CubicO group peptidase (beta-lactamase class C family)
LSSGKGLLQFVTIPSATRSNGGHSQKVIQPKTSLSMHIARCLTILIFMVSVTIHAKGQALPSKWIKTISDNKINSEELNSVIKKTMDSLQIPGLSIAIINNADIVYHQSFGVMNIENKRPVDSETVFEGASLSKPLFAYFFMKMVDKGVVSLDEPMYKLLPHPAIKDNDERYKLITPRMVLSHSTGFPNWSEDKPIELSFTPGQGFSYSGEAHQYLTAYLAIANNTNWQAGLESFFENEVSKPLGLKHTFFVGNDYMKEHKATGYEVSKAKELWLPKSFGAAHTMHSEALDFAKFLQAMIKGEGLSQKLYEEMLKEQNHFKADNDLLKIGQTGWSLGFSMKPTKYGVRYMHTGNNPGFRAYCNFYKERQYGFVMFMNSDKISAFYDKLGKYLDDEF